MLQGVGGLQQVVAGLHLVPRQAQLAVPVGHRQGLDGFRVILFGGFGVEAQGFALVAGHAVARR